MSVSSFAAQSVVPVPMDVAARIDRSVLTGNGAVFNAAMVHPADCLFVVGAGATG